MRVETWWIALGAELHADLVAMVDAAVWTSTVDIEHDGVISRDGASFDRFVLCGTISKPLQHFVDRFVADLHRWLAQGDQREVARIEGRHRLEWRP